MIGENKKIKISKRLSYVLRHCPESIGLTLDKNGWASITELLSCLRDSKSSITRSDLDDVVRSCPKKRFAISDDGKKIRANQGHSIDIELNYSEAIPPQVLYHGTCCEVKDKILLEGIKRINRTHVHLSPDKITAYAVGKRHGKPVILLVNADEMYAEGFVFYLSDNNVWLTKEVPPKYIIGVEYGE